MGACASKFTVLKNSAAAPPADVKQEVESKEVDQVVEEVVVNKDEAPAVEDEANRRQSLGHLLKESEVKKNSAEDVKQDDGAEVKPEAVADAPALDETVRAPVSDSKSENVEEEVSACKLEAEKVVETPAETVKVETTEKEETLKIEEPEGNKGVETPGTDKEPEALEVEKPASNEEKPAEKKTEEQKPASDAEKKETDEKSTEIEVSEKKPESLEAEKTEEQKKAADTGKEPAENTKIETSDNVEDKHVLEPLKTETCSGETSSEEQKPVSDAEKPKAEEVKANN